MSEIPTRIGVGAGSWEPKGEPPSSYRGRELCTQVSARPATQLVLLKPWLCIEDYIRLFWETAAPAFRGHMQHLSQETVL